MPKQDRFTLVLVIGGDLDHRGLQGAQGRHVGRLRREDLEEVRALGVAVWEEHVLLGSEVAEEGSGRHLPRPGDVLDGHALEAPLGELAHPTRLRRHGRSRPA
jgi:hypothetical protein